ncbi:putative disease resistance protein RGA3 [Jatropha curcas]|uniref:putative disease resistance protein RGA3 n=1 Tax=Jatropha curcas TaxID=180498 RepID=UPI00189371E5|nr:putative disease resistance protein RGA3 [Jatropha curcas]
MQRSNRERKTVSLLLGYPNLKKLVLMRRILLMILSMKTNNKLVFHLKIGHKMKDIRERFDEIAALKNKFHLKERFVDEKVEYRRREMTHSFVQASDVIGRDFDRDKIIEYLLHYSEKENLSVVPIIGIGGQGKTTLAKMVYNDERVDKNFQLKMWVCVSQEFDVTRLAKEITSSATEITSSATGRSYGDLTMDQLQARLRRSLGGRKFLLVLDDVWNENLVKWVELRGLLEGCALGSKIIVTTRSSRVASVVGNDFAYNLPGLSHKDCLSLFWKWAFNPGQEKQYLNLRDIGNEIVKKCGGVPLAVRTLGSLLYSSTEEKTWVSIRDNEIWKLQHQENDILPVLKLSYDHMPSYLKRCFAYCSLFPKNYVLYSFELIFPKKLCCFAQLEENGLRFVKELWSRSFLQDIEDHGFFFTCKMHDLVHDLAVSVAQSECSTVNFLTPSVDEKVRHLSFSGSNLPSQQVPKFLHKLKKVRTIFFPVRGMGPSSRTFVDTCMSRFKHLRVLNLSDSCFETLPNSIGTLKNLRYLDLYRNRELRKLPNSICRLQNLQTLRLEECEKLEEIPRDIKHMTGLRFLEITTKQTSLPENGIGCLSSLRYLSLFECGNLEKLFDDMQALTSLRTLVITSCGSLASLPRGIRNLSALETLVIGDCGKLNLMEMENTEDFNLSLSSLVLGELPQLETLPQWLQSSASNLQYMYIDDCPNFTALPDWLQNLTSLKRLEIIRCPELFSLPEGMHCLASLRELRIGLCPELCERCNPETGDDWSKIAHVPDVFLNGIKIKATAN